MGMDGEGSPSLPVLDFAWVAKLLGSEVIFREGGSPSRKATEAGGLGVNDGGCVEAWKVPSMAKGETAKSLIPAGP